MDKAKLKKILSGVAAALGLVAVIMLFLPQLKGKMGGGTINGIKATFGYKETIPLVGKKVAVLKFSFMNLLTYILAIAGLVCAILALLGKGGKLLPFVAGGLFIVSAIFFFCAVQFTIPNGGKMGDYKDVAKLGIGAILGGICTILAGASMVVNGVLKE